MVCTFKQFHRLKSVVAWIRRLHFENHCHTWHLPGAKELTHWGRVTHICVSDLTIIGSDNGLSPGRRQAIIWTNAGLLSIEPLRTYFSENLIKIQPFSLKKMHVKMLSAKWRPFCLGLNVLKRSSCMEYFHGEQSSVHLVPFSHHRVFPLAAVFRLNFT